MIETKEVDRTSYRLVSQKLPKDEIYEPGTSYNPDGRRAYLDNLVCYPSCLADGDRFLLLGENDDEKMRLLIAPREGRALEIRPLSLSFNEAKRRLEAAWEKWRALRDHETGEPGKQDTIKEEYSTEGKENGSERTESASQL